VEHFAFLGFIGGSGGSWLGFDLNWHGQNSYSSERNKFDISNIDIPLNQGY